MYLIILKLYILINTILLTLSSNSDSSLISYDKLKKLFSNLTSTSTTRYTHFLNWVSPSNGSDIRSHPTAVIRCQNQTTCVTPQLQLKRVYNIYYCAHVSYGVRFYFLVKEGLLLHPNVNIVPDPVKADLVFYLPGSADWRKSECNNPTYASKLVVLDEGIISIFLSTTVYTFIHIIMMILLCIYKQHNTTPNTHYTTQHNIIQIQHTTINWWFWMKVTRRIYSDHQMREKIGM
jgi:hypothetical protein